MAALLGSEFLLEIGCEELPAGFIDPALAFLQTELPRLCAEQRITCTGVVVDGTPRRLTVMADTIAQRQEDLEEEITGPAWAVAFDAAGAPTQAGAGFLNKNKLEVSAVYQKESKKGPVVAAKRKEIGRPTSEVLPALLQGLLPKIPFAKTMRWGDRHITNGQVFGRPVQWLLALFDGKPLSIRFADVVSGNTTRGHRYHAPDEVKVNTIAAYKKALEKGHVTLSRRERATLIETQANELAMAAGGRLVKDPALVELVKNLVEKPFPLLGNFEGRFLSVPKELLISEAREHQKYFMVESTDGAAGTLLPCFVVVAGAESKNKVALAAGNARVLRARFEDGAFYFRTDRERTLASRVPDLDKLVFHKELGHYGEKAKRTVELAARLTELLSSSLAELELDPTRIGADATRAALLAKADLMSGVVNEFPELQGIMGRTYALHDGESVDVAEAIDDQYAPRHAGAALPRSHVGAIAGIADRIDTLVGILGIGKAPTGSADPYALRRAAVAVISIAIERGYAFSLDELLAEAVHAYQRQGKLLKADKSKLVADAKGFIAGRLRSILIDRAVAKAPPGSQREDAGDLVDAASSKDAAGGGGLDDLPDVDARVHALAALRAEDPVAFAGVAATFKRVSNIVKKAREEGNVVDDVVPTAELELEAERDLRDAVAALPAGSSHAHTLREVVKLKPVVDVFFDDVMVMVDDAVLRAARLALLGAIVARLAAVADFTRLQG
ncbi:MAG: glycine--tRNA ligase subunit beta [Deltaproteobacteria bacterium]|nr:glycine--tRNA ligase subunit beta [Deltaproteobacteria bacterium]